MKACSNRKTGPVSTGKFTRGTMDLVGYSSDWNTSPGKFTRGTMDLVGYSSVWNTSPVSPRKVHQRDNGSCWYSSDYNTSPVSPRKVYQRDNGSCWYSSDWNTSPVSPRKVYQRDNGSFRARFLIFQKKNKSSFPQESSPEGQWILLGIIPLLRQPAHRVF